MQLIFEINLNLKMMQFPFAAHQRYSERILPPHNAFFLTSLYFLVLKLYQIVRLGKTSNKET